MIVLSDYYTEYSITNLLCTLYMQDGGWHVNQTLPPPSIITPLGDPGRTPVKQKKKKKRRRTKGEEKKK